MTTNTLAMHPDKLETQKQWDADPCGASTVDSIPFGTLAYYRAIRQHRYEVYAPWLLQAVPFQDTKDKDVLEIGVGLGSDHYNFALNNRMTMLDLSKTHLACTQQHMELEGLKSTPTYGDAESMPFEDNAFDLVYSFGVLHHTPHIEKAIAEVHRILRPGGEAWIGLYHTKSWFFVVQTFLINGLVKGNFMRKGWKKTLSMIEERKDPHSATPLVNVYTRKQCLHLFDTFPSIHITTHHVEASHFSLFGRLFNKIISRNWFE